MPHVKGGQKLRCVTKAPERVPPAATLTRTKPRRKCLGSLKGASTQKPQSENAGGTQKAGAGKVAFYTRTRQASGMDEWLAWPSPDPRQELHRWYLPILHFCRRSERYHCVLQPR